MTKRHCEAPCLIFAAYRKPLSLLQAASGLVLDENTPAGGISTRKSDQAICLVFPTRSTG
ncbi:hypothetical protein NBRC116601_27930 [Cognatishimia sp. WU-CL00825]